MYQHKCTILTFQPINSPAHWLTVQSSLPCLLSSLPASMSSRAFYLLQAERCLVVVGGQGTGDDQWVQDLSSILIQIQTIILDCCISHENYPDANGYGKPTSHPIQPHSSTASHGHRTCTRSCLFGLGGGQGGMVGCLRISFEKEKVRFPPQEEYQYKDLTNVAKPRAT